MNRTTNLSSLVAVLSAVLLSFAAAPAFGKPPKQVEVTNFPDPQNVTGAVEVLNLPVVQDVNVLSAPAAACSSFQFVGFSSGLLMGSGPIGVFSAADLCKADFGPRARFCSSEEVLNTVSPPAVSGGPAWVRPVLMPYWDATTADASGVTASPEKLTCEGWLLSTSSSRGLTVTSSGVFIRESCSASRPVACCALVP